jgi:signal transduction histidine kinase
LTEDNELLFGLVLKESARINGIINDFLSYSRMRSPVMIPIKAREFRDELKLQIQQHIAAKGGLIRSTFDVIPEDMEIVADPDQMTQMTLNLVINACEAMDHRGNLRINLVAGGNNGFCELSVADDGPGIDDDMRGSLFEPFKTNKVTGTGLGLSIVSRIAIAHGGQVWAEDTPGGGATFRIRLPLQSLAMQKTDFAKRNAEIIEELVAGEEVLLTP